MYSQSYFEKYEFWIYDKFWGLFTGEYKARFGLYLFRFTCFWDKYSNGGFKHEYIIRDYIFVSIVQNYRGFSKWSQWMKPTNIFKNFTITPFFNIFITLVLTKVPGDTYCSNSILLIYYYYTPLRFNPVCYSEASCTLIKDFA